MRIPIWFASMIIFALPAGVTSHATAAGVAGKSWLISPSEAASLAEGPAETASHEIRPQSHEVLLETGSQGGPTLQVDEPQANLVHSPIEMRIHFLRKSAPVDMSSLEVHAQKWVLGSFRGNLDLSPRVRKFLIADGIDMKDQDIPKGRYRFALTIRDTNGARTESMLLLDVQ